VAAFAPRPSAAVTYNAVSFCERYSAALFGAANTANEGALITAVLTRALFGNLTVNPPNTGILFQPQQMPYFNGTFNPSHTNYYTNLVARGTLFAALLNFFELAMNCRAVTTTTPSNMNSIHAAMNIGKGVWDQFVNEIVLTMQSFGVTSTGATGDLTYAGALLGQFLKGASQAICTGSDCLPYTDFAEFTSGTDASSSLAWLAQDGTTSVSIAVNGNVHWNIGNAHSVVQVDSSYSNVVSGGFTSGAVGATNSYIYQFTTAGTYYFYCGAHPTIMHGKIVVGSSGSGAASVSASVAAVVASVAAASALRF